MIDYSILAKSIDFYESRGFKRIESPWTVTQPVSEITKPKEAKDFKLIHEDNKVMVASGEQSFLYLYLKGFLPLGQFQTVTPCMRKESFDIWHSKYFIKNELIKTDSTTEKDLANIIKLAASFFETLLPKDKIHIRKTGPKSFDLEAKINDLENIELGSYGIRECSFLKWIYGTGVAEPRLSSVLKLIK